ncbi:PAS domain-containing protein [Oceanibaculum pacificum]|uniref:Chemotaxis protein n=1 Tax=Oceanibaculum pacificum TaxID=580166 RepID=A0A154VYT8_9PROT|nr:PAS domain-containing protein [Oceanibaculum pacificum]KZD06456.1 chemotaxis protein [Oceanibaculum pacificum]
MKLTTRPTGKARDFAEDEFLVSKTDARGRILYCNDIFVRLAGYTEAEMLGQPHSIVRHPDMPRAVFKLLWDRISSGHEVFAYVLNMAKTGDHYWVIAHVTPSHDASGQIVGYHSNRRRPDAAALAAIQPLYRELLAIEEGEADRKQGMNRAYEALQDRLKQIGKSYDEFVLSL